MKRTPPHRSAWLASLVLFLLALWTPAGAEVTVFELRASASFVQAAVSRARAGASDTLGEFTAPATWNEDSQSWSWDGSTAVLTNVGLDPDSGEEQWTFTANGCTATVDFATMDAARNGDRVLWLDFQPVPGAARILLVAEECAWDALGLVLPGVAGAPPTVMPLPLGEWFSIMRPPQSAPLFSGRRVSVTADTSRGFWVTNFTKGVRTGGYPALVRNGGDPDAESYPLVSVCFYFDAALAGNHFTLHWQHQGQPEMVQSLTAAPGGTGWQELGDWLWEDETGAVCVTGSVALGATYWLTRDSDGWNSGAWTLNPFAQRPNPLQWSLRGAAVAPVPWASVPFSIATGYGAGAYVYQHGGIRSLSFSNAFTLPDYDDAGNPHHFEYEEWTAQIDPREDFWLMVNGTQSTVRYTWFYNGWGPIGGDPPDVRTVEFSIASGMWAPYVTQPIGSFALTLETTGLRIENWYHDGSPNFFHYDVWTAQVDVARTFSLHVGGGEPIVNDTWFYNGWQKQTGLEPDWRSIPFTLPSGSERWEATVTQGTSSWLLTPNGQSGFIEDYTSDGTGTPHFFYYDVYPCWVDMNRAFKLTVIDRTNLTTFILPERARDFRNGWVAEEGPSTPGFTLALTLNGDRAAHDFTITAPDGTFWTWTPTGEFEARTATIWDQWTLDPGTGLPGGNWNLGYQVLHTTWTHASPITSAEWKLTDVTTGQEKWFNPWKPADRVLDAGQWWLPVTGFPLKVSLSRWSHDLRIHQRGDGNYSVDRIASMGTTIITQTGSWYNSYYYFNATGHRSLTTGLEWWLYDATTGEYAPVAVIVDPANPPDPTDFIDWSYTPAPASLGVWQSNVTEVTLGWSLENAGDELLGGGFLIERGTGSGEWTQVSGGAPGSAASAAGFHLSTDSANRRVFFQFTDPGVTPDAYTYRITYTYGGQWSAYTSKDATVVSEAVLAGRDSDGDGYMDLEEMLAGTNPYDINDHPVRPPPTAPDDYVAIDAGEVKDITLGGSTGAITITPGSDLAAFGTLGSVGADKVVTFTSRDDASGNTWFSYTVTDADGRSATGRITIAVNPVQLAFEVRNLVAENSGGGYEQIRTTTTKTGSWNVSGLSATNPALNTEIPPWGGWDTMTETSDPEHFGYGAPYVPGSAPTQAQFTALSVTGEWAAVPAGTAVGAYAWLSYQVSPLGSTVTKNFENPSTVYSYTADYEIEPGNVITVFRLPDGAAGESADRSDSEEKTDVTGYSAIVDWQAEKAEVRMTRPADGNTTHALSRTFTKTRTVDGIVLLEPVTFTIPDGATVSNSIPLLAYVRRTQTEPGPAAMDELIVAPGPVIPPPPLASIEIGPNMKGVIGDTIESVKGAGGEKHFVTPKSTGIFAPVLFVHLQATMTGNDTGSFDQLFEWKVEANGGPVGVINGDGLCWIPRLAPAHYVVSVVRKSDNVTVDKSNVWVVWAEMGLVIPPVAHWHQLGMVAFPGLWWAYSADPDEWKFKWTIFPAEIIVGKIHGGDVPNLDGVNRKRPPGWANTYIPLPTLVSADTARKKWDVSRKLRQTIRNPGGIPKLDLEVYYRASARNQPAALDVPIDFPLDEAEGNDDPILGINLPDEDDDPYNPKIGDGLDHVVGQVSSSDAPRFAVRVGWGQNGITFQADSEFGEFVRLELWDGTRDGGRFWFRISDIFYWHHALRAIHVPNSGWQDNGSTSGVGRIPNP